MPSCVVRYCRNYTRKTPKSLGITYHAFPADEIRCNEWVKIVRRQRKEADWRPNTSSRICSVHFDNADKYTSKKGNTLLKNTAVPVFEKPSHSLPRRASGSSNTTNSLDNESISDLESIMDTPQETALKKCILKLKIEKQNLIKRNKNLSKRNKRLEEKVKSMKYILNNLKERNTSL